MLFERTALSPQGRLEVLVHRFEEAARRTGVTAEHGHVPVETLEAYGDFATHVRYLLESAAPATKEQRLLVSRIERLTAALPDELMQNLTTGPDGNWMSFYRKLIQLHGMIQEADIPLEAEEYSTFVNKMVQLADAVSRVSAVEINAASMFTLLLLQMELQRQRPKRRRPARKKKRKTTKGKKATTKKAARAESQAD